MKRLASTNRQYTFCIVFLLCFLCQNFSLYSEESSEEELYLKPFVQDFFCDDSVIYTLFGSKPMTSIQITNMTKEQCTSEFKELLDFLEDEKNLKGKEFLLKKIAKDCGNNTLENYKNWVSFVSKFSNSPFLFRGEFTDEQKKYFFAYVANVREVAWTMQKHYDVFSRELDMQFNPLAMALDFSNLNSDFWKKTLSNSYLVGILYGYGERNAFFFSLIPKDKPLEQIFASPIFKSPSFSPPIQHSSEEFSITDLQLPRFRSFEVPLRGDPTVAYYEEERKLIQEQLKDKNLTQEIYKKMIGS